MMPGSHGVPHLGWFGTWWIITPAVIILIFPLGFRLTCYYYRKADYRSWWLSRNKPGYAGPRYFIRHATLDMYPLDAAGRRGVLRERQGLSLCNITKCCTEACRPESRSPTMRSSR
jgi:hypothetical protein